MKRILVTRTRGFGDMILSFFVAKSFPGMRFQILLEIEGLLPVFKSNQSPRFVFRGMVGSSGVMCMESRFQILGKSIIGLVGPGSETVAIYAAIA